MNTILSESTVAGVASRPTLATRLLAVLAGLTALGALSTNIILSSFPSMAADLGVGARDMGWALSSFLLAFALGQLFVDPASDRWGRRVLVVVGLALFMFMAGSVVCLLTPTLPALVAGRVLQALGAARPRYCRVPLRATCSRAMRWRARWP